MLRLKDYKERYKMHYRPSFNAGRCNQCESWTMFEGSYVRQSLDDVEFHCAHCEAVHKVPAQSGRLGDGVVSFSLIYGG